MNFKEVLKRKFEILREQNLSCCIPGYFDVLSLNINSSESFARHDLSALLAIHFVGDHMERALSADKLSMYSEVAPLLSC
jgi:hypothetical protein